jgi:hypothetical protein
MRRKRDNEWLRGGTSQDRASPSQKVRFRWPSGQSHFDVWEREGGRDRSGSRGLDHGIARSAVV